MELDDLIVFHRGEFRRYADSKVGLLTHALHYGTGCYEGIRAFWNERDEQLFVFEPRAHFERLAQSANVLLMNLDRTPADLAAITAELCRRNAFRSDVYIRPVVFKSEETFGVRLDDLTHDLFVVAFPNSRYLDSNEGLNACISSWRRIDDNAAPARAKITGTYVNSALAKSEARLNGFDEAIMLTDDGHVSEGSAANIFVIRGGVAYTPDVTQNILEGVTRRVVQRIIERDCGLPVVERAVDRSELYSADEILLCGTGVGVAWLRSLDRRPIGKGCGGDVAATVTRVYGDVVRGLDDRYGCEVYPVYPAAVNARATDASAASRSAADTVAAVR